MLVIGREFVEDGAEDSAYVVFEDEFALVDAFKQLAAQAIDGFALLVHHVVVFEQMFARFEVLRFNALLRVFNRRVNHLRLDRHVFFHDALHHGVGNPLLGEDAHEVVFKRQIEARGAGIALAAGASTKLIVDAA